MQACCEGQSEWEEHAMSENPQNISTSIYHNHLTSIQTTKNTIKKYNNQANKRKIQQADKTNMYNRIQENTTLGLTTKPSPRKPDTRNPVHCMYIYTKKRDKQDINKQR